MSNKKENEIHRVVVQGTDVALKHDFTGWRVVRPYKNADGSRNWKNIIAGGSWIKFFAVVGFVVIILGAIFEYVSQLNLLTKCLTALNDSVILFP